MASSSKTGPQLAVSAAIFLNGRCLLVRRAHAPASGLYTLPGGRVEWGEPLNEALAREIREETSLDIEILGLAGWREILPTQSGSGHYVILPFAAHWRSGDVILNDELDDARWLLPNEIGGLPLTEGLQGIVAAAARMVS
jgi:ADP-ribose pyrophosphatase YjhB (NUDIX family)